MKAQRNKRIVLMLLLLALSFGLRAWGIGDATHFTGDEAGQIPAAKSFVANGQSNATFWHHPPFGMLLIGASIELLGDNPYGWRIKNLVLGSLMVMIVFLIAGELFADLRVAFLSGLLLALDPLHVLLSRTTFDEIPATFFFLSALYVAIRYLKGNVSTPFVAGIFLGCSLASKLYFLMGSILLILFIILYKSKEEGFRWGRSTHILITLTVLPLTVFALTYLPWFGRGYDMGEFLRFQVDALRDIRLMTLKWFEFDYILKESGLAWEWFVRPKMFGLQFDANAGWGTFIMFLNNPPVWLFTWPALLFAAYRGVKQKNSMLLLPPLFFASVYIPFLLVPRPVFMYSTVTIMPFAFMALAYGTNSLLLAIDGGKRCYPVMLTMLLAWCLYLYPLASRRSVPIALYAPVLSHAKLFRMF